MGNGFDFSAGKSGSIRRPLPIMGIVPEAYPQASTSRALTRDLPLHDLATGAEPSPGLPGRMRYLEDRQVARYFEVMPRPARRDDLDKFRRYRANQKRRGMKLVRLWVPDPKAPGFRRQARRQASLLRGASEEQEALEFIERAANVDE
jgi:hypothetical protein